MVVSSLSSSTAQKVTSFWNRCMHGVCVSIRLCYNNCMEGKKRMTLDELARMVKEGFDQTASKADMERGFAAVGTRLDRVEGRLEDIDTRLSTVERLLTSSRIDRIEDDLRVLKTKAGIR